MLLHPDHSVEIYQSLNFNLVLALLTNFGLILDFLVTGSGYNLAKPFRIDFSKDLGVDP